MGEDQMSHDFLEKRERYVRIKALLWTCLYAAVVMFTWYVDGQYDFWTWLNLPAELPFKVWMIVGSLYLLGLFFEIKLARMTYRSK